MSWINRLDECQRPVLYRNVSSLTFFLLFFNIFLIAVQQDDSIYESFQVCNNDIFESYHIYTSYVYSAYYNFITLCSF